MSYDATAGYPDLTRIRAWIQVPATVLPDDQLDEIAEGEQLAQAALDWGVLDLPGDVRQAFYRRVARSVAAKGIPLGILAADAEFGLVRLSGIDTEIARLEAPYVVPVIA
jgi:hypothetical protein